MGFEPEQIMIRIRELKETILLLDVDLVDSARQIQELNVTRSNSLALQQKLRLILYVNQALSAPKLLVASADSAGALDVTDDLQHLLVFVLNIDTRRLFSLCVSDPPSSLSSLSPKIFLRDCSFQYGSLVDLVDGHTSVLYHRLQLLVPNVYTKIWSKLQKVRTSCKPSLKAH
ncbi:hypothetical protein ABKV19_003794 [Rosa sericea]